MNVYMDECLDVRVVNIFMSASMHTYMFTCVCIVHVCMHNSGVCMFHVNVVYDCIVESLQELQCMQHRAHGPYATH